MKKALETIGVGTLIQIAVFVFAFGGTVAATRVSAEADRRNNELMHARDNERIERLMCQQDRIIDSMTTLTVQLQQIATKLDERTKR